MSSQLTESKLKSYVHYVTHQVVKKEPGTSEDYEYAHSESGKSTKSGSSKASVSSSSGIASTLSSDVASFDGILTRDKLKKIIEENSKPAYRLAFKTNGDIHVVNDTNPDDIDFLKVHAVEELCDNGSDFLLDSDYMDKQTRSLGKINVTACIENSEVTGEDPMVKISFINVLKKYPITLLHLLWINMYERELLKINSIKEPIAVPVYQQAEFFIPVERFELSKPIKMVIYYGTLDLLYCKEFIINLTTRPRKTLVMEKLEHHFPAPALRTLDRCSFKEPESVELNDEEKLLKEKILTYEKHDGVSRLNNMNFYSMLKLMLQMEDETDSKRSMRHDQYSQSVKHEYGKRYSLFINNKRLEAAINEYTRIWITPQSIRSAEVTINEMNRRNNRGPNGNRSHQKNKKDRIYGSVVKIQGNLAYFELNEPLSRFKNKTQVNVSDEKYFIRFMNDRTSITLEHRALEFLNTEDIAHFFFPSLFAINVWPSNEIHPSSYTDAPINWISPDINAEQKSAIVNILKQTAYPYPYVLYGPPGTGKTKTLVEAISQIVRNENENEFILACSTSNSACNEVAKRLIEGGITDKVFRIFSKSASFDTSSIPPCVLNASNLATREHYFPSLDILCTYKVVVCTLTTAGRLSQGKIDPRHFSHVFIDEAGSATESQTLIALAGLCTGLRSINANIILAGDPKQLGPLIKSQQAVKMGYGVSMLERLVTTNPLYMKNETTKEFNTNYVTQLVRNYRSHEAILHVSNELYYDNKLKVCAPEENINWFINSAILKSPKFPVVFHSVQGKTIKERNETSPYNLLEIDTVIQYLNRIFKKTERKIEQRDIGIISPYRKQCEQLTEQCAKHGWNEIQIGSVEVFQGQEKPIILVSTVRSNSNKIGFLDNKKRLNVLMTRAKCLLLIIGDADTLAIDEDWSFVIEHCKANNALIS